MKISIECGASVSEMQRAEQLTRDMNDLKSVVKVLCREIQEAKGKGVTLKLTKHD